MQISSFVGQYSSSVTSTARQSTNRQAEVGVTPSVSQSSHQKKAEPGQLSTVSPINPTENRGDVHGLLAARRHAYGMSLVDSVRPDVARARANTGQFTNQAGFRAASEYQDVASQQQREELTTVLGIDVFA